MKIARVFPTRTSYSPTDADAYFAAPTWFTPMYDEVHVSCVFTWDKKKAEALARDWKKHAKKVLLGGPAYNSPVREFVPGMYVAKGITFATRGCPNKCGFCRVPELEGDFRELPITAGNIVQDNNILAASDQHWARLMQMLKTQKGITFKGGLECRRLTDARIADLRQLRIKELWLACDYRAALPACLDAISRLMKAGYKRDHLHVYTMIGKDMQEELARMQAIFKAGALTFAQLYQPPADKKKVYSRDWTRMQNIWQRPAKQKAVMDAFKNKSTKPRKDQALLWE